MSNSIALPSSVGLIVFACACLAACSSPSTATLDSDPIPSATATGASPTPPQRQPQPIEKPADVDACAATWWFSIEATEDVTSDPCFDDSAFGRTENKGVVIQRDGSGLRADLVSRFGGFSEMSVSDVQQDSSSCDLTLTFTHPRNSKEGLTCRWSFRLRSAAQKQNTFDGLLTVEHYDTKKVAYTKPFVGRADALKTVDTDRWDRTRAEKELRDEASSLRTWCGAWKQRPATATKKTIAIKASKEGHLAALAINGVDQGVSNTTCTNLAGWRMFSNASGQEQAETFVIEGLFPEP